jgi:hypothetical protein
MIGAIVFACVMLVIGVAALESRNTKLKRGGGILPTTTDEVCYVRVEPHSLLLPRIRRSTSNETFAV